MSLTTGDLKSIKDIVHSSETRLIKRIDELDDTLSIQMENGLQEVRDELRATADRIEKVQLREAIRMDEHGISISQIRKALHSA